MKKLINLLFLSLFFIGWDMPDSYTSPNRSAFSGGGGNNNLRYIPVNSVLVQTTSIGQIMNKMNYPKIINTDLMDYAFEEMRNNRTKVLGIDGSKEIEKRIFLQSIDLNWKSHIQYLEQLRQVIGLRSYGQRDPLIEYKKEAFSLFENLLTKLKLDFISILLNLKVVNSSEEKRETVKPVQIDPKYIGKKMSRNEPCLCGSGKKYKRCCGAL